MITVETTYQGRDDFPTFPTADGYTIDSGGNLALFTSGCQLVALFAAGKWMSAKVTPNRDAHGRFVKRGA